MILRPENWVPIASKQSQEVVREISVKQIQLFDNYFGLYGVQESVDMWYYNIWTKTTRPYEYTPLDKFAVRYELSMDLSVMERVVYSILELLGDIGGLKEAIQWIFFGVLFFF